MALPQQGYQWGTIGALGTTVITANAANLVQIIIPGTYVGTVTFHDASAAAGTTATSGIITLGLPTSSIPNDVQIHAVCKKGILYQATGTPIMTYFWDAL